MRQKGLAALTGNIIGADAAGTQDRGNAQDGVRIDGAPDNSVGVPSPNPQTGNLISGNDGAGVHMSGEGAEGNKVQHNGIGVQKDLTSALGNGSHGVWIDGSNNNLVGGTASTPPTPIPPNPPNWWVVPNTLNIIAHNGDAGVFVDGTGNSIRANNIYDNGSLGIDLSPPGPNDRKLTSALWSANPFADGKGGWVQVPLVIATGYIHGGWANTGVVVEGFITSEPDPSGYGEGEKWVVGGDSDPPPFYMDADGNMSAAGDFRSDAAVGVVGKYFTDTVTNVQDGHPLKGTTLEFSNSVKIAADEDGDGIADGIDTDPGTTLSTYPNFFSDGITSGDLISPGADGRNGCSVSVVELSPQEGVVLGAACWANQGPAHLTVCGGKTLDLPAATSTILKCGSADFSVGYGPVFFGVGTMKATLPTAAKVHFSDPVDGNYEVSNDSTSPTIWVGGVPIGPGQTVTLHDTNGDGIADGVAVGGIAELPALSGTSADEASSPGDGSGWSASDYAALASGLAAAVVITIAGAWYARRRWHKA